MRSRRARRPDPPLGRSGFDVTPARPPLVTALLFLVVTFVASAFAHLFKWALRAVIRFYSDRSDSTGASSALGHVTLFLLASTSVLIAASIGHVVQRRWNRRVGIEAVAASARGDSRSISFRATVLRVAATWIVSAGLVSIGRESAIVESGGVVGSVTGRESGGRGDALASAGIASAFASAYNAPVAAVLYVEEHLRVRRSVRATTFVVLGALSGHVLTVWLFDGESIFPEIDGASWDVLVYGLLVMIPVVIVSRIFLQLRVRVGLDWLVRLTRWPRWSVVVALSVLAGLSVVVFPLAAGNGMDALQRGPREATITLALALVIGKMVGTTAALGAGAPGGVLSPTMGVAAGCALLVLLAAEPLGLGVEHPWDAMVAAMAIGVAVGMRSPLVAIFLIPEMLGDYPLVAATAVVVGVAWLLDRALDRLAGAIGLGIPSDVYDSDA